VNSRSTSIVTESSDNKRSGLTSRSTDRLPARRCLRLTRINCSTRQLPQPDLERDGRVFQVLGKATMGIRSVS